HGPKGVGALYARRGVRVAPQVTGGPQERERRGGTENVPGIVGMGAAADLARAWLATDGRAHGAVLRDAFEGAVANSTDATVHGHASPRLWNTTNIGFARLEAEAILLLLSERGVFASAGAACSSGSLDPSPVLLAMGIAPEIAHGSIRFSLSRDTTKAEVDAAAERVTSAIARLRASTQSAVR
ncbi:MAG: cysteine desulfurase family protein, partial [Planctomycetota bacterium]